VSNKEQSVMSFDEAKAEAIRQSHHRWEKTRSMGRQRYILTNGVFWWGGIMVLGYEIGQLITSRFNPALVLPIIAVYAIGGYLVGAIKWRYNERAYSAGQDEELD
jgi:hypothetical protein